MAPLVCKLYDEGVIEARGRTPSRHASRPPSQFARAEGIMPGAGGGPRHRAAPIDEALRCKEEGKRKTILFNLCGHGHFDLGAYEAYLAGKLQDYEYPAEKVDGGAARACPSVQG